MSQIDEAFIQAYATPQAAIDTPTTMSNYGAPPVAPQPPLAGLHAGPHIHLHPASQAPVETQPAAWAPEPIPAPHFRVPHTNQSQETVVAAPVQAQPAVAMSPVVEPVAPPPTGPALERRPLSTFAAPAQPATTAFRPLFEVDAFRWPKITGELLDAHHALLLPVLEQLLDVSEQGRSLVGIAGTRPGIGCTTVQLCLARLLASAGKSVALVDANFAEATLAHDLGLEFDTGWENVLAGELPLAECVVKSLEDRMALLPLARPSANAAQLLESIQTSVTAGVLRYHYDLVLFNLGAASQPQQQAATQSIVRHCRLDASILIADTSITGTADAAQIDPLMSLFGSTCLGVIGNTTAA